jgi:hypothetical protein
VTEPRQVYRGGTFVLSLLMIVVGVALLVSTIVHGGGALALGILFGVLFIAAGGARLYFLRKS